MQTNGSKRDRNGCGSANWPFQGLSREECLEALRHRVRIYIDAEHPSDFFSFHDATRGCDVIILSVFGGQEFHGQTPIEFLNAEDEQRGRYGIVPTGEPFGPLKLPPFDLIA